MDPPIITYMCLRKMLASAKSAQTSGSASRNSTSTSNTGSSASSRSSILIPSSPPRSKRVAFAHHEAANDGSYVRSMVSSTFDDEVGYEPGSSYVESIEPPAKRHKPNVPPGRAGMASPPGADDHANMMETDETALASVGLVQAGGILRAALRGDLLKAYDTTDSSRVDHHTVIRTISSPAPSQSVSYRDLQPILQHLDDQKLSWPATVDLLAQLRVLALDSAVARTLIASMVTARNSDVSFCVAAAASDTKALRDALVKSEADNAALKKELEEVKGDIAQATRAQRNELMLKSAEWVTRTKKVKAEEQALEQRKEAVKKEEAAAAELRKAAEHKSSLAAAREKRVKEKEAKMTKREMEVAAGEVRMKEREEKVAKREERAMERDDKAKEAEKRLDIESKEWQERVRTEEVEKRERERKKEVAVALANAELVRKVAEVVAGHAAVVLGKKKME